LSKCKLDFSTSPSFRKALKKLKRDFPHIDQDCESLKRLIEADHANKKINATCLRMPGQPSVQGKVWKYDFKLSDLNKNQRECGRLICLFLEVGGDTLYAVTCFHRPGNDYVSPKEMAALMCQLKEALSTPLVDDPEEDDTLISK